MACFWLLCKLNLDDWKWRMRLRSEAGGVKKSLHPKANFLAMNRIQNGGAFGCIGFGPKARAVSRCGRLTLDRAS
jgi:hypothetical protein